MARPESPNLAPAPPAQAATWKPLLEGESAERARESVSRVAEALVAESERLAEGHQHPSWRGFDVPGGSAGISLTLFYLADSLGRPELAQRAHGIQDHARVQLENTLARPALHGGFSGVGWVEQHLADRVRDRVGAGDDLDTTLEPIDSALLAYLGSSRRIVDYDLVSGLVGLGVYGLERLPAARGRAIVEAVVRRLVDLAEARPGGIAWRTPPEALPPDQREATPDGHFDLGIAHGAPGVLAFLARSARAGVLTEECRRALGPGVTWLLRQKRDLHAGLRFASWIPAGDGVVPHRSRVAWCYGDLGVAAALQAAAVGAGEEGWSREAVAIAANCAGMAARDDGIRDHGLCHGTAGVGHTLNRLAQATGSDRLADAARAWLERTLAQRIPSAGIDGYASWMPREPKSRNPGPGDFYHGRDDGFLTGAAGVALALAAGFSSLDPAWDRVLLLS